MNGHSQTNRILKYMKSGRSISPITALNRFGCFRLAARVRQMREAGISVRTKIVRRNNKSFALYSWP